MSPKSRENDINDVPDYVNGLISLGCGGDQIICNPSTGKSITLPKVKTRKKVIRSFFGYDPVDGQYKVLCMSEKVYHYWDGPSYEHQVFTLGGVDKSWKMIECNILHRPKTNGVCINGVVYYGALTGTGMRETCLGRFDVRSEKLKLVQFLGDHNPPSLTSSYLRPHLISYKGKVTLAIRTEPMRFELWILEDAEKHAWSKVCFSIGHLSSNLSSHHLRIRGNISGRTDDIVFVSWHTGRFTFLYYDHTKNIARNFFTIEDDSYTDFSSVMVPFSNYVESVMLL